ncbi:MULTISPECIES: 2Fe-2S iron-sulfur cluster-binding protein [Methylosinus]|uniref:Oxidoreductase n=1 Tax=Methylosinus trichosporium (strain ATCC 35070 / NCIMB 11131 / UNIQEM 75 / OB3b) TaxID=595536 RepID=A0A2D2D207_METT3|nr:MULTISPECIES: 2Fe-2S iron-sulfur cluster-binding protein [Methylosinus]ATQ69033.1 oxidoreductase [Methylosinus trichosporium OB3b]OBS50453.1 oxidoreductase [Methylosinus sp. 3S-1]
MFKVNLVTRDGASLTFDADSSDTLLDAAAKANIFLPAACREGGCGTCRVTRKAGVVALGPYSRSALSDADRAAGDILLCRAEAHSDLELTAPFDKAAIGFSRVPERSARITDIAPAGTGTVRLVLRYEDDPTHGRAAEFIPGQFMELTLPGTSITRAYSLANTPNWEGTLEFSIRLHPQGAFSAYLRGRAEIGDALCVRGPQGSFVVDEASQAPRWFVAGGTGVAPILSMLRQMAELGDARDARLFFGVNTQDELFATDVVEELSTSLPDFGATLCVWRPGPDWSGFAGTPAEALAAALADSSTRPDIYVCGPSALIEATETVALAGGVPHDRIFSERFSPA